MLINYAAEPQLHEMTAEILSHFGLERMRLEDAAFELQVDLEMWHCDSGYSEGSTGQAAFDPYEDFLRFAAELCFDPSVPADSALVGITHRQMYLLCAWNFVEIASYFSRTPIHHGVATAEGNRMTGLYRSAAGKLIECARDFPLDCYPCGSPSVQTGLWN